MRKLLTVFLLSTIAVNAFAQKVTGVVTDASDDYPIPGVAVIVKGTHTGVSTGLEGEYSIAAPQGSTLVFSCMGYTTVEVKVEGSQINIKLEPDSEMLEEVVAIGYGVMKKSDVTGSVTSVKGDQLQRTPAAGLDQALQGVAAGVTVNASTGQPGAAAEVRIRGIGTVNNAAPIYVVDGVIVDNITFLSPMDIASTEILKDASATAIYGSRGANGVILVTTKKGSSDGTVSISFDASAGIQNPWRKLDLMGPQEFASVLANGPSVGGAYILENQGLDAWMRSRLIGTTSLYHPSNLKYATVNTDWQEAVFNRNAIIQNYHLSVNGGNQQGQWSVSASWFNQDGTIIGSDFTRLSLRATSSYKVTDWLKVGENISFMSSHGRTAMNNSSSAQASILSAALAMAPWDPIYYPQGAKNYKDEDLGGHLSASSNFKNVTHPYAMVEYSHPMDYSERWVGDVFVEITPIKNLVWRSDVSMDLTNNRHRLFKEAYILSSYDKMDKNFLEKSMSRYSTIIVENTLTWMKEIGKLNINLMGGQTMEEYNYDSLSGSGSSILVPRENNWYLSQTTEDRNPAGDGAARNRRLSFLGRAHFSYDSRYMVTLNFRADGTSKFKNHIWGYFPSLAAAWRIDNEPWFNKPAFLESLKLRAGWGRIGNDKIGDNASVQTIFNSGPTFVDYVLGADQQLAGGATILTLVNTDIKWETTEQLNAGVDFGLWRNKLTGTIDVFQRDTKEMLLGVTAPAHVGNRYAPTANVGTVRNTGIEISTEHRNHIGDWDYSVGGNVSFIKNELTALNGGAPVYGDRTKSDEGLALYTFWGYKYLGIYSSDQEVAEYLTAPGATEEYHAGDAKYEDLNKDGKIDDNDMQALGNPFPWLTYGLNASANWKNFDFQIFFQGVYGNEIYNALRLRTEGTGNEATLSTTMRNVWTESNPGGTIPNPFGGSHNKDNNSRFVEDGSYLRLKSLQLGYTLPQTLTQRAGISRMRVSVIASNLLTLTRYTGYDPEVGGGVDYGNYPQSRTVQLGLNLNF
ncbi:MAG: TonB-dependent receptor [Bacteroidales bacterium]|nr:TonB-dependent receptor [Bacteroidales bacterium]